MKYILEEDECAPDAREYFEKEMLKKFGITVKDFKEKGVKTEDGYEYNGFILEIFIEEQWWHLRKANS
jgi:hypothetical protein